MTKRNWDTSAETMIGPRVASPGRHAVLLSAIKADWQAGRKADALLALAEHPELAQHKNVVLDLAYEEYCTREESGEEIDVEQFCNRFAQHRASVQRRLQVHGFFEREATSPKPHIRWPAPPQKFCGFELLEEIGQGAIGRVYLARQRALGDRLVVLKVSRGGRREAHLLGRLQHPNVIPVYSIVYDDERRLTCVCMPLLGLATFEDVLDQIASAVARPKSGAVFAATIRRMVGASPAADRVAGLNRKSFVDALLIQTAQVADALAYLHAKGICHRDLKPSNILLTDDARPMLLDFNLSAELASSDGRLGGTLPYMAPEQIEGMLGGPTDKLDARADVFSMGVILYELLTGTLPFGPVSKNLSLLRAGAKLLEQQAHGADLARLRAIGVDRAVIALVGRCLAIQPDDRFATAEAAAAAIRNALRPLPRARRWMRAHRLQTAAAAVILASSLCFGGAWLALRKPYHERLYLRGAAAIERGELPSGIELLNESIQEQPDFIAAIHALARAQLAQGEHHVAMTLYKQLHELTGEPQYLASVGYCNNLLGSHREAIEYYCRAIKGGYRNELVLNNLGYSHQKQGNLPTAREQFDAALRINPAFGPALQNRAMLELRWAVARKTNLRDTAVGDIESIIAQAPGHGNLHYNAAKIWHLSESPNNVQKTLDHVERAISLGIEPKQFTQGKVFESLLRDSRMMRLLERQPAQALTAEPPTILDPDTP